MAEVSTKVPSFLLLFSMVASFRVGKTRPGACAEARGGSSSRRRGAQGAGAAAVAAAAAAAGVKRGDRDAGGTGTGTPPLQVPLSSPGLDPGA